MSDDFRHVESHACPMSTCAAPAGSPCRTGKGKVAIQYHTARFRLAPQLAKVLSVPTPAVRKPGSVWTELPRPADAGADPVEHVRLGYARASSARQPLDAQLDSLAEAGVTRIFSEKISTRATQRPELEAVVRLAGEVRSTGVRVTLVVHEHKRLGRGIELAMLAEELKASDVGLEFLTGELKGSHDPSGIVFTVLAAMSGMEREYIRDRTLEGHESARKRGKTIGGAGVTDDHMLSMALHLRDQEMSLRDIAKRLVITTGKKKGQHPSPATVMRMLREHDEQTTAPSASQATDSPPPPARVKIIP
ncbi:recombinase family protein [Streptomyces asiaticus]